MAEINPPFATKLCSNVPNTADPQTSPADIRKEVTAFFRRCSLADAHYPSHCHPKTNDCSHHISALTQWDHFVPAPVNATVLPFTRQPAGASGSITITEEPPGERYPVLRLRFSGLRLEDGPSSGAAGGGRPADLPPQKVLLNQIKLLAKELELVTDQLSKADEKTLEGKVQIDQLNAQKKVIDGKINDIKSTYNKSHGPDLVKQFLQWRTAVERALGNEDSTSPQAFGDLQNQIQPLLEEIEYFLLGIYYQQCMEFMQQLHQAKTRKAGNDRATFVRELINSNKPLMQVYLRGGDDQHLSGYFEHLKQYLASLEYILKMPGLSAGDQQQTQQNIIITTTKVERIAECFAMIPRYTRLHEDASYLYPHQPTELQQTIRKGKRLSASPPSPMDQERRAQVAKLKQERPGVIIDEDAILDMEEQDFQLVMAVLGKKPLTAAHQQTLQRNGWQQTDRNNLVVNRGHEKVRIEINEDRYQLIDNISGHIIGTLTPDRWERIKQRLERENKSLDDVTRQMVHEDFKEFKDSPYQRKWSHNVYEDH
ncbi:hypothetical protein [Endozoicomonas sp. ONNA2]|uniref:hypothetical protein n=1 Tax=Endozoicomonas sp. ONNA2 TaxID=2828741 RepID=UPI00214795BB|nr:hypothetical protein [Endozoicomonas sp. ONNA2]